MQDDPIATDKVAQDAPKRPVLTMPADAAQALTEAISAAKVVLEYGSGGSTVLAAEATGKTVFSVESDAAWLAKMQEYFAAFPPLSTVHMHHGDIGATKAWGHPANTDSFRKWPDYAGKIWTEPHFVQPDLVLIDGRFRVACFLATQFMTKAPVTVLFDDYIDRPNYHFVEQFTKPSAMIGRMARFELKPKAIPAKKLLLVMQYFLQPA